VQVVVSGNPPSRRSCEYSGTSASVREVIVELLDVYEVEHLSHQDIYIGLPSDAEPQAAGLLGAVVE